MSCSKNANPTFSITMSTYIDTFDKDKCVINLSKILYLSTQNNGLLFRSELDKRNMYVMDCAII